MTCVTCGSATATADSECTMCDPWAVKPAQSSARVQAAGLSPTSEKLPKWMEKVLALRPEPAVVEAARNRPLGSKSRYRSVLAVYVVLGLDFFGFCTRLTPSNYEFVANFRFLALAPVVLLLIGRFRRRKRVKPINWLAGNLLHIRDNRPELGFRWIATIKELRISIMINRVVFPAFIILMEGNLFVVPHSASQDRTVFLVDGIAFIVIAVLSWLQATVLLPRAYRKITSRVAR